MRSPVSGLSGTLLLALLAGCAFSEGSPWGTLEAEVTASFAPSASRLTAEGWLRTSNDYAIALDALEVGLGSLTVAMRPEGGAVSFDPAAPPPGYSLCHNGHCHSADGRLVSYEEIEAELNGGAAPTGATLSLPIGGVVPLDVDPRQVSLEPCPDHCDLERGELGTVALSLTSIHFAGRVFDASTAGRLPAEGVALEGELTLDLEATAELEGAVDRGEPLLVRLDVHFPLTERLFDNIDWPGALEAGEPAAIDVRDGESVADQLRATLDEFSTLSVGIDREEL